MKFNGKMQLTMKLKVTKKQVVYILREQGHFFLFYWCTVKDWERTDRTHSYILTLLSWQYATANLIDN